MVKQLSTREIYRLKNIRAYNKDVHGAADLSTLNESEHEDFENWVSRNGKAKSKPVEKIHFISESTLTVNVNDLNGQTVNQIKDLEQVYMHVDGNDHLYNRNDVLEIIPYRNRQLIQIQARLRKSKAQFFSIIH